MDVNIKLNRLAVCSVILGVSGLMLVGGVALLAGPAPHTNTSVYLPLTAKRAMPNQFPNCRLGAAASSYDLNLYVDLQPYGLSAFNLSWYMDWTVNPNPQEPAGIQYVQNVRVRSIASPPYYRLLEPPTWADLEALVRTRPNDLYIIGNEPDNIYHENLCAPVYASMYHDVYTFIKSISPAARVGVGSVTQPTPLRREYLDRVWNTYQISYGQRLPTDFWSIHSYILTEERYGWWGAFIPPCMENVNTGTIYSPRDQDNMQIFTSRIRDFRQWMAEKGERDKPLYITEYGILFPEDIDPFFGTISVTTFMWNTFQYFLGPDSIDPTIGYPRDNNRLVQRVMWFSLAHDPWQYGGALFDPPQPPTQPLPLIRPLGYSWVTGTHGLSPWITNTVGLTPSINLMPYNPTSDTILGDPPVTATVRVEIVNNGNYTTTNSFIVTLYDENWIPVSSQTMQLVPGCGEFNVATLLWPNLPPGIHTGHIRVDPDNWINETNESDNEIDVIVTVLEHYTRLPLIAR